MTNRRVLNWIQEVTDTTPLLMVVGGYSDLVSNGITNDIELISTRTNNLCTKFVKPYYGTSFNISGFIESEGDALGMTGQFTNEAPIFCGGKNGFDNLNTCYEFDFTRNE